MADSYKYYHLYPSTVIILSVAVIASIFGCLYFIYIGELTIAARIPAIGILLTLAMFVCERAKQRKIICVYLLSPVLFLTVEYFIFRPSRIDIVRSLFFYTTVFVALVLFDCAVRCSAFGKSKFIKFILGLLQTVIILVPTSLLIHVSRGGTFGLHELIAMHQTNLKEAIDYMFINLSVWEMACAISLTFAIILLNFKCTMKRENCTYLLLILFLATASSYPFVSLANHRFNDNVPMLCKITGSFNEYLNGVKQFKQMRASRKYAINLIKASSTAKNDVHIIIIGESENRDYMGVYGYKLNTTPWLSSAIYKDKILCFKHAYSCHTQTVEVLSQALTQSSQYAPMPIGNSLSLMDVCMAAGYFTVWISNQREIGTFDSAVSVLATNTNAQYWTSTPCLEAEKDNQYDSNILKPLSDVLSDTKHRKKVIICHLRGSHFRYSDRYPDNFTWQKQGLFSCTQNALPNTETAEYVTSILYTDYILSSIINLAYRYNVTSVTYFSDHAEDVKNTDHTFSNFSYSMSHIPMFIWCSNKYITQNSEKYNRIFSRLNIFFTNDLMYDTLIGLYGIKTTAYKAKQDIFSKEYTICSHDLMIGGKYKVINDPYLGK